MNIDSTRKNENEQQGREDESFEEEGGGIDDADAEFCVVHGLVSSAKKESDTCSCESDDMV